MTIPKGQPALPVDFNLESEVSEIEGRDGETYLQFTTHMVTFYKQTYGEHSRFFMALRDGRLIGAHCSQCKQVMVPAATWHCPNCNFAEMTEIDLPHRGVLAYTAPITIFPSASFLGDAPFARGYVDVATEAPIASFLPSRLRTTTGLERPGIFVKGIEFQARLRGRAPGLDPRHLLGADDRGPAGAARQEALARLRARFHDTRTAGCPQGRRQDGCPGGGDHRDAQARGRRWQEPSSPGRPCRSPAPGRCQYRGGDFSISVADSRLSIVEGLSAGAEHTLVADDPAIFTRWVHDGSLTDAAVEGTLWLPHKEAFQLLPVLDRLPRSTRRDLRDEKR